MKEVFSFRQSIKAVHSQYKLNLEVPKMKHLTFANKSMKSFRPKIWNSLPLSIKSSENLNTFKEIIKAGMEIHLTQVCLK